MTFFILTLMSVAYSESLSPLGHGPNLVHAESLQISFCQKLLGTDQTMVLMMISISLVHSLSLRSLRRTTNSVYYESFENCIYSIVPENRSNHLFHDNFNVCGIFCKL